MEASEKFYEELRKLEEGLPTIEREEWEAVTDPETEDRMITLLVGERLLGPNDRRIGDLQKHFDSKAKEIRARREAYHSEYGRISRELTTLTGPVIRGYVEELSDLGGRPKLSREIVDTQYDGRRETTILSVMTNEKAILGIRNLVKKGIAKIQSMGLSPISEIRAEFSRIKAEIEAVDWHKTERIDGINEADVYKFSPPQQIDPNYKGPPSGLR
jgi:hypothetical protein